MQIKVKATNTEISDMIKSAVANRLGVSDYEITQVEIESPAVQSSTFTSAHKIALIKFLRQAILDFYSTGKLKIPPDETEGTNPPRTVGLGASKIYVEEYFGI